MSCGSEVVDDQPKYGWDHYPTQQADTVVGSFVGIYSSVALADKPMQVNISSQKGTMMTELLISQTGIRATVPNEKYVRVQAWIKGKEHATPFDLFSYGGYLVDANGVLETMLREAEDTVKFRINLSNSLGVMYHFSLPPFPKDDIVMRGRAVDVHSLGIPQKFPSDKYISVNWPYQKPR